MNRQLVIEMNDKDAKPKVCDVGLSPVDCEALQAVTGGWLPWRPELPQLPGTSIMAVLIG
jgi:hypothetical protein